MSMTWRNGLCDCCAMPGGCGLCFLACCCPCCAYAQAAQHLSPQEAPCGGDHCGSCCGYCALDSLGVATNTFSVLVCLPCVGTLVFPFVLLIHVPMRQALRKKYNISGDGCTDCVTLWCCRYVSCFPCYFIQHWARCTLTPLIWLTRCCALIQVLSCTL